MKCLFQGKFKMAIDEEIPDHLDQDFKANDVYLFSSLSDLMFRRTWDLNNILGFLLGIAVSEMIIRDAVVNEQVLFDPFNVSSIADWKNDSYFLSIAAVNGYLVLEGFQGGSKKLLRDRDYVNYFHVSQMNGQSGNHAFPNHHFFIDCFATSQTTWPKKSPLPIVSTTSEKQAIIVTESCQPLVFGKSHCEKYEILCNKSEPDSYEDFVKSRGMTLLDPSTPNLLASVAQPNFPFQQFQGTLDTYDQFGKDIIEKQAELAKTSDTYKPRALYSKNRTKYAIELFSKIKVYDCAMCLPRLMDEYLCMFFCLSWV